MILYRHQYKNQGGFTLVELALVMIIIGLLIGGILKGQELIANSQITATISQVQAINASVSTFRGKYKSFPGDLPDPTVRLRDCNAAPCNDGGDGNGRIDTPALGDAPTLTSEGVIAFAHIGAADLLSGIDITGSQLAMGSALPEARIGGGFWLGHTADGSAVGGLTGLKPGHYMILNGVVGAVGGVNGGITTTQAAQVDRKLDDGSPLNGDVQAVGAGCVNATDDYEEALQATSCSLYIRVQG